MAWTTSASPRSRIACAGVSVTRSAKLARAAIMERLKVLRYRTRGQHLGFGAIALAHAGTLAALPTDTESIDIFLPIAASLAICIAALRGAPAAAREHAAAKAASAVAAVTGPTTAVRAVPDPARPAPSPAPHTAPPLRDELRAELMARVCHELRTPLNAVVGFADVMDHELFGPLGHPRYAEYVSHIRESSERLLKSAEDTLAMTSLLANAGQRRIDTFNLRQVVRDALASVAADGRRKGVDFAVEIDLELHVACDRRALRQALVNLFAEAIGRSAPRTTIEIRARGAGTSVALALHAPTIQLSVPELQASLAVCLARTMLELEGCDLAVRDVQGQTWRAEFMLERSVQADFFDAAAHPFLPRTRAAA